MQDMSFMNGLGRLTKILVQGLRLAIIVGWMIRIRVDRLTKGSSKMQFKLLSGKLDQSFLNPAR